MALTARKASRAGKDLQVPMELKGFGDVKAGKVCRVGKVPRDFKAGKGYKESRDPRAG